MPTMRDLLMRVRNERGRPVPEKDEPSPRIRVDVDGQGASASGNAGPVQMSIGKYKGAPVTGDITVPVGNGSVQVGRDGSGKFFRATQRIGRVGVDAGYDKERGAYVEGRRTLRWGNK